MKVKIYDKIFDTEHIFFISEINDAYVDQKLWKHTEKQFGISFFNGHSPLYVNTWLEETHSSEEKEARIDELKKTRKELIDIWSNNQGTIPQIGSNDMVSASFPVG